MQIKLINNLTAQSVPMTFLSSLINAGTNVLPVRNLSGFTASYALQIGQTGEQNSEIVLLSASTPSGTLGTLTANTLYDHASDTPIFQVKYDMAVFERSTTGTAGTAIPITNGTISIQCNGSVTQFDDTTGVTTYAYKTMFRNSVLGVNSSESDWITPQGFSYYSLGKMRQRVKDKLVSAGYISGIQVDDSMINDWLNEYKDLMDSAASDLDLDYNIGTTEIAFTGTQELGTINASDFRGGLHRVLYADPSGTFLAQKMDSNTFSPNKTWTTTFPYFYMQGDTVIGRKPSDNSGTLQLMYYKLIPPMQEDTDILPQTQWAYTKGYIDYAHGQALFKDQKIQEAQAKEATALAFIEKFKKDMTPRNKSGMDLVNIVEDTAAEQELFL